MIKKIIHCSDIHIRKQTRHEEYKIQIEKFLNECKTIVDENKDETIILVDGDIFDNHLSIGNEQLVLTSWFLKSLDELAPTVIVCGNHDLVTSNLQRMDSITPLFEMIDFKQTIYLDKELNYKSGSYIMDNIVFCLYSIFDSYNKPFFEDLKVSHSDKTFIGLIHAPIVGSETSTGFSMEKGLSSDSFQGLDFVLLGDIHKQQDMNVKGVELIYSGSLIQQSFGETVTQHGFCLMDIETKEYEFIDIPSDYGFYKFKITSKKDIEEGTEKLLNL